MSWELTGNGGTNPPADFLGTTDGQPLVIKTNSAEAARITPGGNIAVGTSQASQKLTLGAGNTLFRDAKLGIDGNLYFGGITDAGQTGLRLFGGLVNGSIPAGFVDVRTTTPTDGLRIRVDTSVGGTERMRVTSNNIQFFVPTSGGSDVRTKTSIRRLDRVLDKLDSVRGVAFNWAESPQ